MCKNAKRGIKDRGRDRHGHRQQWQARNHGTDTGLHHVMRMVRTSVMHRDACEILPEMIDEMCIKFEQGQIGGGNPGGKDRAGQLAGAGAEFDHAAGLGTQPLGHGAGKKA